MKLVFAGSPKVALPSLEALAQVHEVLAVVTRPPARGRRGPGLVPTEVGAWAQDRGVPVLAPESLRDPGFVDAIHQLAPDACCVVAYGGLITRELLAVPRHGWVNLHFSLLPAYRGAAPVQHALLDGCTRTGLTTFSLVPALDAGPVFRQLTVDIDPYETSGDLLDRLATLGAGAMLDTVADLALGVLPVAQPAEGVSLAPKLTPDQGRLDVGGPAAQFVNKVRAFSPDPGAWLQLCSQRFPPERFRVLRAVPASSQPQPAAREPGTLVATKNRLYLAVHNDWVDLVEVQAGGKKRMAGADWARGGLKEGDRLE